MPCFFHLIYLFNIYVAASGLSRSAGSSLHHMGSLVHSLSSCSACSLCLWHAAFLVVALGLQSTWASVVAVSRLSCFTAWDLSSPTRDLTCVLCIARWILSNWTTREIPHLIYLGGLFLSTCRGLLISSVVSHCMDITILNSLPRDYLCCFQAFKYCKEDCS